MAKTPSPQPILYKGVSNNVSPTASCNFVLPAAIFIKYGEHEVEIPGYEIHITVLEFFH